MTPSPKHQPLLVVAVTSRALFNFEEENRVFEGNPDAYVKLQLERVEQPAEPGVAFPLVKKLLTFNTEEETLVEVVVLSRNDPVSGLRVFKSATSHALGVERGVFTCGRGPYQYLRPFNASLFLSASAEDVRCALDAGFPAALVYPKSSSDLDPHPTELRIAFDGDAVLFGDEAEHVFQDGGLSAFQRHETERAGEPLPPGPFKPLLEALQQLRLRARDRSLQVRCALVTARSVPSHERAIRTLMTWKVNVDEAMFLGGLDKAPFLREWSPDFYFDDQTRYCEAAAEVMPTGLVIPTPR